MSTTVTGLPLLAGLLAALLVSGPVQGAGDCPSDRALEQAAFRIHPSTGFDRAARAVLQRFGRRGAALVYDTWGPLRSLYGEDPQAALKLFSYDDPATAADEQYGDVVLVFAFDERGHHPPPATPWTQVAARTPEAGFNRLVEVRWWQDGERQLAYDANQVRCAAHSVPMAVNALF